MDVSILFPLLATTISMSSELLLECYVQNTDKKVITIFRLNQPFFDRYLTDTIKMGNLTLNFVNNNFSKLNETKMATITEKISKKSVIRITEHSDKLFTSTNNSCSSNKRRKHFALIFTTVLNHKDEEGNFCSLQRTNLTVFGNFSLKFLCKSPSSRFEHCHTYKICLSEYVAGTNEACIYYDHSCVTRDKYSLVILSIMVILLALPMLFLLWKISHKLIDFVKNSLTDIDTCHLVVSWK